MLQNTIYVGMKNVTLLIVVRY